MKTRTDKEQAEYLLQKIEMKERSGLDNTEELCEALEFIFEHSVDRDEELDLEKHTKEFMKMHNIILPENTEQRLAILIENVEQLLPKMKYGHSGFKEAVKDMYITLDAISHSIYKYKEGTFYDVELPEDEISAISNKLYAEKDDPGEEYYKITTKYIAVLIEKLEKSFQTDDIVTIKTIGIRLGFQSMEYEYLYIYQCIPG